ncbi:CRISPR-associated protein Cas5 [Streptomyces yatensis]|uniref:CRISPR-associated protein Cas5 n=1 Tax=Streptomyces yatensis TaxID=155177 RepID=UPI001FE8A4B9|nr:CRISPR-associated protein Cas5 [Streptomyces yatensis]
MSRGLVLRAAGLLQSYGEAGTFHHRDTTTFPTRSALIGMFAAAQGRTAEHALDPYPELPGTPSHRDLALTIRVDCPGTPTATGTPPAADAPTAKACTPATGNTAPKTDPRTSPNGTI